MCTLTIISEYYFSENKIKNIFTFSENMIKYNSEKEVNTDAQKIYIIL